METTMRKIFWAAPLLLLAFLMVFAFGCQKKSTSNDQGNNDVGQITILLGTDTLRYLPGDSASTAVTVIVTSRMGTVMSGVKVSMSLANPGLGFIQYQNTELVDTTDAQGRVNLLYTSIGQPGLNTIMATNGGVSQSVPIAAVPASEIVCELRLIAARNHMQTSINVEDTTMVEVRISDCEHNAIVGVSVQLSATGGRLSPLLPTDSAGTARTTWYSNGQFGLFWIKARAGGLADSQSVQVDELPNLPGTLHLTSDRDTIPADNCVTRAHLTAILQNQLGIPITNDTVWFAYSNGGSTNSMAVTDSQGFARMDFCGILPSVDAPNYAVAIYPRLALYDTTYIWITPALQVTEVNLTVGSQSGLHAGVDSTSVTPQVFYEDGSRVSGLTIYFNTTCGTFTADSAILVNGTVSNIYYRACPTIGTPLVWATVNDVSSEVLMMGIIPGAARYIQQILANSPSIYLGQTDSVHALITDSLHNPVVAGVQVSFSTNLGTVNPPIPQTGDDGRAWTLFTPGTQAGQANIRAQLGGVVDSIAITVISGQPNTIQLTAIPTSIQVQGTGGISTSQLRANVNDANGNPVPDGTLVTFRVMPGNPGGGVNINNHGLQDTALTAGGLAVATLNAGTNPGPVQVQACTMVNGNNICALNTSINIVSGPPANITIYPTNVGVDIGGSGWEVEISAYVVDALNNPVRDETAVFFEVYPDTAQIVSDSVFVGNPNSNGDVHEGVCYARLRYNSNATFETVFITARTGEQNPISEQIDYVLPLQEPAISLNCLPDNWCFDIRGTPCRVACNVVVTDGHSVRINGALIDFGTQRGQFYTQQNGGTATNQAITGPNGNPPGEMGQTALWLRGSSVEMFPDPLVPEASNQVTVEVHGYPAATDAQLILMRRGCGPGPN